MQQNCLWLHPNQVFKPGSSYDAQRIVLSISLLSACFAMQDILNLFRIECISCLLPYAWRMQTCTMQACVLNNATVSDTQHLKLSISVAAV